MRSNLPHISVEEKLRLSHLFRQVVELSPSDEGLLRSVVDRWPWFHEAWVLLSLWEQKYNPGKFQALLPLLSLRAANRQKLDHLILYGFNLRPDIIIEKADENTPKSVPSGIQEEPVKEDRTAFLESLVKRRLEAIAQEKAAVGHRPEYRTGYKKDEIIDRFIREEPRIKVRKDINPEPDEKAERSLQDENSMVSETLARIHEKQGNYRKAIEIYRSLSLKYPQKSTYFAAQIESLQEKLKP